MVLFRVVSVTSENRSISYSIDGSLNSTFQSAHNSENSSGNNGSFVWDSRLNGSLSLKLSKNILLSNILKIGYGQINIKTGSSNIWSEPMINSDFINYTSSLCTDDRKKFYGFLCINFKSSFFDQIGKITFNPYTLSGASGATFTLNRGNLMLSMSASAGIVHKTIRRLSDSSITNEWTNKFVTDRYSSGSLRLDVDFDYIISQYLYLNTKCQISQSFATSSNTLQKQKWYPPELSWTLTLNVPVTSYLNFFYSADLEVYHSPKTSISFNQALNAGLYFNLKSK
jgi:hypothetical protein